MMDLDERQEMRAQSDELLVNYRPRPIASGDLSHNWSEVWDKFRGDVCSFIIPDTLPQDEQVPTQKHNFSVAGSTLQLRRVILQNSQIDIFPQIRKEVIKIFYIIANSFVGHNLKGNNLLIGFLSGYARIAPKINIIISCLTMVLNKYITKRGIEKQFHSIINKELNNHPLYQKFVTSCLDEIDDFRDYCLVIDQKLLAEMEQHPILNKLKLLNLLTIFPYLEYLQRSKKYYAELLPRIPKNIAMFPVIYAYIQTEKMLAIAIPKDEEKLQKVGYMQTWRANEPDCMIRILCKQIINDLHVDMIQYLDFLIQPGNVEKNQKLPTGLMDKSGKKQTLKYLWEITKVLSRNMDKLHLHNPKIVKAQTRLLNRLVTIIGDIKGFIVTTKNSDIETSLDDIQLYKIIEFKDNLQSIIQECFDSDPKFLNSIVYTIESTITEEEDIYNEQLCAIILNKKYQCPITNPTPQNLAFTPRKPQWVSLSMQSDKMVEQKDENKLQAEQFNNHYSYQLFKLTSSKQQFIRRFEQKFSQKVLSQWSEYYDLTQQQYFIKAMQKQCGYLLCKNIEKMLADVWRNGEMVVWRNGLMNCRLLSQDWPEFTGKQYRLMDVLIDLRDQFERFFHSQIENDKKKITWIQQCGRITIQIAGIGSIFSELQASILLTLGRSFRPMKSDQIYQILQYKGISSQIDQILSDLTEGGVLSQNSHSKSYEVNYDNIRSYQFVAKKAQMTKQKKPLTRDRSIIVEAFIARILKRKKSVQKTDLSRLLGGQMKEGVPNLTEIHHALEKLMDRDIISIEKSRGIVKYIE